jgi:hypothetical protein
VVWAAIGPVWREDRRQLKLEARPGSERGAEAESGRMAGAVENGDSETSLECVCAETRPKREKRFTGETEQRRTNRAQCVATVCADGAAGRTARARFRALGREIRKITSTARIGTGACDRARLTPRVPRPRKQFAAVFSVRSPLLRSSCQTVSPSPPFLTRIWLRLRRRFSARC